MPWQIPYLMNLYLGDQEANSYEYFRCVLLNFKFNKKCAVLNFN